MAHSRLQLLPKALHLPQCRTFTFKSSKQEGSKDLSEILETLTNPNPRFIPRARPTLSSSQPLQSGSDTQQMSPTSAGGSFLTPSRSIELLSSTDEMLAPYHLHCYSQRHNTHLTLSRPNREPLISLSAGNIGFRKGKRGDYESGFQLSAYFLRMMNEKGYFMENSKTRITSLEIVLRGFAEGRKAFLAALMGVEGFKVRKVVSSVSDATRLKIGGTRAPNPRRL